MKQNIKQAVRVKKLSPQAILPAYATPDAAGADICACLEKAVTIEPGKTVMIGTGLALELPAGIAGLVYARSGLAGKKGLAPANKVGVIDPDYRGELIVALHNHSDIEAVIKPGERIAQLVLTPFLTADFQLSDSLDDDTPRGKGGFGSTG